MTQLLFDLVTRGLKITLMTNLESRPRLAGTCNGHFLNTICSGIAEKSTTLDQSGEGGGNGQKSAKIRVMSFKIINSIQIKNTDHQKPCQQEIQITQS